jgi:predicted acetyltransferase
MPSDLRLRPLRVDDEAAALAADDLLAADDFPFLLGHDPGESWETYITRLDRYRRGIGLVTGLVPASFLVAVIGADIVGRVSVRHQLNDFLATWGGHIGYGVLPAVRRRGYATEMLGQGLVIARSQGVDRVLVTCDAGNLASAAVIERCGGVYESTVDDVGDGPPKRRFWID